MDTIKRLGENETVRRISNGTLKSYVDREIDTVDTSAFINLETLNVPKAESVTIGEGVKDTLEVLNAPKAEEVAVSDGKGLTVNWGKCGGSTDVVVTYKEGEPLYIPKEFLTLGKTMSQLVSYTEDKLDSEVGYKTWFSWDDNELATERQPRGYFYFNIYKLPQELGKWLYDNSESNDGTHLDYDSLLTDIYDNPMNRKFRGIALYPDTLVSDGWSSSFGWCVGIRKKKNLCVTGFRMSDDGELMQTKGLIYDGELKSIRCIENYDQYKALEDDAYYLIAQASTTISNNIVTLNPIFNLFGDNPLYLRHYSTMTVEPDGGTNMGEKYTAPSSLAITPFLSNNLSNLSNLKVADVHSADVDVPMFKGCTNLERATIGGTKKPSEGITVNWGRCGGTEDVEITYNIGEPLWIPKAFLAQAFNSDYTALQSDNFSDHSVGYKGNRNHICIYKLPQFLGRYLYENAENCKTHYCYYKDFFEARIYKGIATYSDTLKSGERWLNSNYWGVGIRTKEDIRASEWQSDGTLYRNSMTVNDLEDGVYYLVAEQQTFTANQDSQLWEQLSDLFNVEDDDSGTDHIYLRHCADMLEQPNGSTSMGEKYTVTSELLSYPTLDSSYFEGCDNLKEVTITNPELRVGNAIPKTMTVNWGKCGGSSDVVVEYGEGDPLWVPKAFLWNAPIVGKDEIGLVDNSTKAKNPGQLSIYRLPQKFGKWLYDNAESVTEEHPRAYDGDDDYAKYWKGIATYPDLEYSGISESWWPTNEYSNSWNVGIRTGADLKNPNGCRCINYDGTLTSVQDIISETTKAKLNDNDYYLVLESAYIDGAWKNTTGMGKMLYNATGLIYFRHWNTLESSPNGTTVMGEKYTTPSEFLPQIDIYADETKVPIEEAQPLVVNWGECGGEEDVIVTYNMGEGLWIPHSFLWEPLQDFDASANYLNSDDVGYKCHTEDIVIYKLPQEIGKYLYDNAEDLKDRNYYGLSSAPQGHIYKGIAIYPDNPSAWTDSKAWGVGIRKKIDIGYYEWKNSTSCNDEWSYWVNNAGKTYLNNLKDDDYYLVAQRNSSNLTSTDSSFIYGQLYLWNSNIANDTGTDHIYFRHTAELSQVPDADHKASKYTVPAELCRPQKNVYYSKTKKKDSFTVNWGKCGGASDVVTTFKVGDPLYIPKEFLEEGYDESTRLPKDDVLNGNVGYQTWFGYDDWSGTSRNDVGNSAYICVYKLPQELGEWLYENAEDSISGTTSYAQSGLGGSKPLYHGIAIYPDTVGSNTSSQWTDSYGWGVGIRKKEDIVMLCLDESTYKPTSNPSGLDYKNLENFDQWKALEDDAYYLVSQCIVTGSGKDRMESYLPMFENPIYFRRWNTLTSNPTQNLTTHGEKYKAPSELCSPLQITMAEYLKENNPNYDFRER